MFCVILFTVRQNEKSRIAVLIVFVFLSFEICNFCQTKIDIGVYSYLSEYLCQMIMNFSSGIHRNLTDTRSL